MDLKGKVTRHRVEILELAKKNGAFNVRVFGSVSRGESGKTSDIDLLVEMEPGRTLFDLVRLEQDLSQLLGSKVQVVSQRGLKPRVRERVLAEAAAV